MGRIGRVLSYVYTKLREANAADIKTDLGGGDNRTAQHFQPAGQVSQPLADDYVATMPVPGQGREAAIGFVDPKAPQDVKAGEHLTYARDENGDVVCSVHLGSDGAIVISANVSININGVAISPGGVIEANSIIADGKELVDHDHSQAPDSGGNTEQDTGPNN